MCMDMNAKHKAHNVLQQKQDIIIIQSVMTLQVCIKNISMYSYIIFVDLKGRKSRNMIN